MKKTTRLNDLQASILLIAGLVVGSCGFAGSAVAYVPFVDNFEGYQIYPTRLAGQGDWETDYTSPWTDSAPTLAHSGDKVLYFNATTGGDDLHRIGTAEASGEWKFWFRRLPGGSSEDDQISIEDSAGTTVAVERWLDADGTIRCGFNSENIISGTSGKVDTWLQFGFRWDMDAGTFGCFLDGTWYDYTVHAPIIGGVNYLRIFTNSTAGLLIDDITGQLPPGTIAGWSPVITPVNPLDGVKTVELLTSFSVSGQVKIPTANPYTWHDLNIVFKKWGTSEIFIKNIPLPDLTGGQTYDYDDTFSLDDTFLYSVSYNIQGETDFYTTAIIDHRVAGTYVTHTAALTPTWTEVTAWTVPTLDDCSILTGLDKLVCEIKNALLGLVVPSQSKYDELSNTMAAFQDAFPLPYLRAFQTFVATTDAGISESAALNFSILGQAATVDFSVYSFSVSIAGLDVAFNVLIRSLLSLLCLAFFLAWAVSFLRSVF